MPLPFARLGLLLLPFGFCFVLALEFLAFSLSSRLRRRDPTGIFVAHKVFAIDGVDQALGLALIDLVLLL